MPKMRESSVIRVTLVAGTLAALVGCGAEPPAAVPRMVDERRVAMGSDLYLTAWTADAPAARAAFAAVGAEFERLEALLSVWREGSDVTRMNQAAGVAAVPVHADTRRVLRAAAQVSAWTEGKFDITFGALAEVWKFDHDMDNRVPTAAEVAARLPRVDYRAVVVDDGSGTAFVTRSGVRVHLGGIGKGYAVGRGVAILRAAGLRDFMVQAGGDLYAAGSAGDTSGPTPWRLGIQDPRGPGGEPFASVEVEDGTVSTSGDYERFFVQDGVRYHHILDPATGQPARGCRSVTIVARDATLADGLSTGVFILGPERGMALVEALPDVEAVIVTADNQVRISSGLTGRVTIHHPPTP